MSEFNQEFYNWLDECPTTWRRGSTYGDCTSYVFTRENKPSCDGCTLEFEEHELKEKDDKKYCDGCFIGVEK